ncbi:hypothetical protein B0H17DRAFT_1137454 [Mycena rosella]|uniref:Uncharacterized protein n=1 Tax=Mycena rosella TaxID=1033263 RepID=A0AAD7GER0_MYCRO|nr:hypothetical protein B0H17DRAFT_1137454 [Mycena rosella]
MCGSDRTRKPGLESDWGGLGLEKIPNPTDLSSRAGVGSGLGLTVIFCSLPKTGFSTPMFNHHSIKMVRPIIAMWLATFKGNRNVQGRRIGIRLLYQVSAPAVVLMRCNFETYLMRETFGPEHLSNSVATTTTRQTSLPTEVARVFRQLSTLASRDADTAEDAYFNLRPHIEKAGGSFYMFLQQNERMVGLLSTFLGRTEVDYVDLKFGKEDIIDNRRNGHQAQCPGIQCVWVYWYETSRLKLVGKDIASCMVKRPRMGLKE